jgi:hypothetical protein
MVTAMPTSFFMPGVDGLKKLTWRRLFGAMATTLKIKPERIVLLQRLQV